MKTYGCGATMRCQPFDLSKNFDCLAGLKQVFPRELHKTVAATEVVGGQPIEHARRAARRQHMTRAGNKVTG